MEGSGHHFNQAVNEVLLDMGCLCELPDNLHQYLVNQISMFKEALNGFNMLQSLLDAGVRVSYHGVRSYCSLYKHPNLVIEKTGRPPKILVYAHPFLAYGASEALLSAIGGGTVPVTDANGFMVDNFPEVIIYERNNFAQRVTQLLQQPAELAELGCAVREKVLRHHMPRHRAEKILMAVDLSGNHEVSLYE